MIGTWRLSIAIGLVCLWAADTISYANFDQQHPPHHAFNAQLLQPGEFQTSIVGNIKYGVLDTLELGTQAAFLLFPRPRIWNLSLKHRMFDTPDSFTSFSAHSFLQSEGSNHIFVSLHGIIHSRPIVSSDHLLSLGIFDGNLIGSSRDASYSVHFLTPSVAFDSVISKHWAFSVSVLKPIYAIGEANSEDSGEDSLQIDFTRNQNTFAYSSATFTYSGEVWNTEFGVFSFSSKLIFVPYFNLFWRFHAN